MGVRSVCAVLTAGGGLIRSVGAVGPSIAVPVAWDAAAAGATELTLGTRGRGCRGGGGDGGWIKLL